MGPRVESMAGLLDGYTAQGGSGSALSWLNMDVWWWLETICFCQSTKLPPPLCAVDKLVVVKRIKGGTLINEILWHQEVWWLPALECFSAISQIKFKKNRLSVFLPCMCVCVCLLFSSFPFVFVSRLVLFSFYPLVVPCSLTHTHTFKHIYTCAHA